MTADCTRPDCKCCPRCGSIKRPCDECCYCAPAALCFRVVDQYDEALTAARLPWDEDLAKWTGTIICGADELDIDVTLSADEYGDCYWHVFSYGLGIDDHFPADDGYGERECSPSIDIPDVCGGTAQIRAEQWVTPEYYRGEYGDECPDYFCSSCKCLCEKLCLLNEVYEWNGGGGWEGPLGTITIARDEYSGACVITAPGYEPFELDEGHNCTQLSIALTELDGYGTATLTCWQCTCAREIPCPEVCVNTGNILVGCGALSEYPVFYLLGNSDRSPLLRDDGSPLCCDYPPFLSNDEGTCVWVDGSPDPGSCVWTFHPETPKVQLERDGFTWVWIPDGTFDPLCTSVFVFDPDQSNPDPDCDVYTELCVSPNNGCCDGGSFRDEPMPETLHAEGLHCCGIDPMNPTPPVPFDFDLTWDPVDRKWKGETAICSGYLRVHVSCICGTSEGCGGGADPCYLVEVWFKCDTQDEVGGSAVVETCFCDPFELIAVLAGIFATCCAAEVLIDLVLTIFE